MSKSVQQALKELNYYQILGGSVGLTSVGLYYKMDGKDLLYLNAGHFLGHLVFKMYLDY